VAWINLVFMTISVVDPKISSKDREIASSQGSKDRCNLFLIIGVHSVIETPGAKNRIAIDYFTPPLFAHMSEGNFGDKIQKTDLQRWDVSSCVSAILWVAYESLEPIDWIHVPFYFGSW